MRYGKFLLCVVPLLALVACDDSGITNIGPPPPAATVRFINLSTDWGTLDLRFPDQVENLPTMLGVPFRNSSGFYQRVAPGNRLTRVFPYSTNPDTTKIFLVDTSLNLVANQRYTMMYTDRGADGAPLGPLDRLAVLEDPAAAALPTPAQGQVAIQALHGAAGVGNVDVYIVRVATATAATPADWLTNHAGVLRDVGFRGRAGAYVNVPVLPAGEFYRFVVTAANSTEPIFAATPSADNQAGAAATASAGPRPGTRISGSVLTAVVAPGATPGTRGAVAANLTPTVFVIVDKVLDT